MAYDWRDALRRKLPHDTASGFPALPMLCRFFFLQLLEECDAEGRIRVGAAAPAEALAVLLGAHVGERRLVRQYVPALLEGGFLRVDGGFVCLRPLEAGVAAAAPARRTATAPDELATSETNSQRTERTSNESDELATSFELTPRNDTTEAPKPAESVSSPSDGSGGSPVPSSPSLPHTPSLTSPSSTPSDRVGLEGRATPAEIVEAAVRAGVAAGLEAAKAGGAGTDEPPEEPKSRAPARPDAPRPLPGTPAAEALEAIEATQLLREIVPRPAALAVAVTTGAYPAIDVPREIAAGEAWLVANPANRKKKGDRFLSNWLSRAQERAARVDPRQSGEFTRPGPRPTPEADPGAAIRDAAWAEWERKMRAAGKEIVR